MGKFPALVAIIVAVVLSVLGIGVVANAADQVSISITNTLSPANVTIHVGTTVTWTNNDSQQHELRSTGGPAEFRTDNLDPGQTASFTLTSVGTYTYVDHGNEQATAYHGTIVVTNDATPTTPPATTPPRPAPAPSAPSTATIHLAGARFAPSSVTVAVGATVTWINDDGSKHTVNADNASFDSGTLNAGATFVQTFTAPGTYPYGCDFHGNMRGTISVVAAGSTTPPPAAPPTTALPAQPTTPLATGPPAAPGAAVTNEVVSIAGNLFSPSAITVNAGSTVTWTNNDTVTHTVTADDQSFASGLVKKTTAWSHTFATPGTFTYFCEIHPEMSGTVIAKAADGTAPAAAPAPSAVTPAAATTSNIAASTASTSTASTGASSGSITISDTGFTPASFRVALGGTITFANSGKAMHTVTAGSGSFDSDMIKPGGSWAHTFTTKGSFAYNCILHPGMKGTIDVGGGGAVSAAQATSASQAAGAAAQTDSPTTPAATTAGGSAIQPVNIDVADNEFKPNVATVAQGGTVTWTLVGATVHTVTADDQSFSSGLLKPGATFQNTFTTLGSFSYSCLVHPGMTATIKVVPPEEAAAAQQAAPPANGDSQALPTAGQPPAAATTPNHSSTPWAATLFGIAAVLLACCALVFSLKSFLKILGSDEVTTTSTNGLAPHAT